MSHSATSSAPLGAARPRTLRPVAIDRVETARKDRAIARAPAPHLYLAIFTVWIMALIWFHPRLAGLLAIASGPFSWGALAFFIVFTELAWLYGLYNLGVVFFAVLDRRSKPSLARTLSLRPACTEVAVLYTTCNDFVEQSAQSCVDLDYSHHQVYILDDGTDPAYRQRIDAFAARWPDRVTVVRRGTSRGFKAGNLNYALQHVAREPLFVVADADEILPRHFLRTLVPQILADPNCGFIQANHRANPRSRSELGRDLGTGIDIHWRWYQPLRNRYGFVMFLGHGALLKRMCWERVGGFPEMVSEDLAYALAIREHSYYGRFAEHVVCYEDFPESVRAFRVRHVKWTRGTSEFLKLRLLPLLRSRGISWIEKLDVLFPTLNLPLSLAYFFFMVDAGVVLPWTLGSPLPLTVAFAGREVVLSLRSLPGEFTSIFSPGFYLITVTTILAPVLCFIAELYRRPWQLFRFLTHSTVLYAALSPLSALSVLSFGLTGKARFLVTGDKQKNLGQIRGSRASGMRTALARLLAETHPDHPGVRLFELACAEVFLLASVASFQVSFFGLALAFLLLPLMHVAGWNRGLARGLIWLPFPLLLLGLLLGGLSVLGLQPVLFGFGFHF